MCVCGARIEDLLHSFLARVCMCVCVCVCDNEVIHFCIGDLLHSLLVLEIRVGGVEPLVSYFVINLNKK